MSPERAVLSPAVIQARLEGLRELHLLGMSLLEARPPPISRDLFLRRCLAVQGLVGVQALAGLSRRTPFGQELAVFTAPAGIAHHVGREFDLVQGQEGTGRLEASVRCILIGARRQSLEPADGILKGASAIALLRFPEGAPALLQGLPVLDRAGGPAAIILGTHAELRRLKG